ncbi:MAG: PAQR family membrane homeostasis protein TrhA [Ktedonobacterales bacterium]
MLQQELEAGEAQFSPSLTLPTHARPEAKPLLRGWLHAAAACVTALLILLLSVHTWQQWPRLLPLLIFAVSTLELYTVSAVFHIWTWRTPRYHFMRTLDHSSIFVAIAGSYTPLGLALLVGWLRVLLLGTVWLLVVIGILVKSFHRHMSRTLSTSLYVGLGWVVVLALPAFWTRLPGQALVLLGLGGLCYTAGALVYSWRWPNPSPRVFGFHELFHLLVVGGSAAMALVIWFWIAPLL